MEPDRELGDEQLSKFNKKIIYLKPSTFRLGKSEKRLSEP